MASITKKIKKRRTYYYASQSARVNGKPRIVWQKYLGTIDAIVQRAEKVRPAKPKESVIFEAGGVAALLRIAQRLKIDQIMCSKNYRPPILFLMFLVTHYPGNLIGIGQAFRIDCI